jgi:hypothetical protein
MRLLLGLVAATLSLGTGAQAQSPTATTTYVLQTAPVASREGNIITLSATAPKPLMKATIDRKSLLALVPIQGHAWELQRLTSWESSHPKVQRLIIDGDPTQDKLDYKQGWISLSPDGKFAVVQILLYHFKRHDRRAVIVVVDLTKFEVISRQLTTDPPLANSHLTFHGNNQLVAAEGPSPTDKRGHHWYGAYVSSDGLAVNFLATGGHDATMLSFPEFTPDEKCHYEIAPLTLPAGAVEGSANDPNTWWSPQGSGALRSVSVDNGCQSFSQPLVSKPPLSFLDRLILRTPN